jgi:hypothetical protein
MEWLAQLPTFVNDALPKTVLLIIGAAILKKWPAFVNKAIPVASLIASALISTFGVMFPPAVPEVTPTSMVAASFAGVPLIVAASKIAATGSWLWNTLAPLAFAVAMHSGGKNTRQWVELGGRILWPGGVAPR